MDSPLFTEERRKKMLELLQERKKITVPEFCQLLQMSPATIRTDLRELDQAGLITRTHGGALEKVSSDAMPLPHPLLPDNLLGKQAIAAEAAKLVENGDTIILDSGTTTLELARCLTEHERLTIVTNDLAIALFLESFPNIHVILSGGTLYRNYHCTIGPPGQRMMRELRVDKAMMSVSGLSAAYGAGTADLQLAETKRTMISIARQTIVLCDHRKIGRESFVRFAETDQMDVLVTDRMDFTTRRTFEEHHVRVVVCSLPLARERTSPLDSDEIRFEGSTMNLD
ncbi:MAG: DeoR/GlpR family DNA-binding transcription regulator [Thermoguttaceae bacterium]|nr:DeoR/GlpR family DNA-binding transcription regulator [Thermoguttaceae bacterium]